jgi:beta-glucosidase
LEDEQVVKEIHGANPRTILVLQSSFPYAINWSQQHLPAILHITHCSQETGSALADVLFGDYNPGGKLTQTWPKSIKDLPDLLEYDLTQGHTYLYSKAEPLYPFGYGLSFTTFKFEKVEVASAELGPDDTIHLTVTLANTGSCLGDEVVQAYVGLPDSRVYRPIKQLRAFKRVTVKARGRVKVRLAIPVKELAYWDEASRAWVVEPGRAVISVGPSSAEASLVTEVQIRLTAHERRCFTARPSEKQ